MHHPDASPRPLFITRGHGTADREVHGGVEPAGKGMAWGDIMNWLALAQGRCAYPGVLPGAVEAEECGAGPDVLH